CMQSDPVLSAHLRIRPARRCYHSIHHHQSRQPVVVVQENNARHRAFVLTYTSWNSYSAQWQLLRKVKFSYSYLGVLQLDTRKSRHLRQVALLIESKELRIHKKISYGSGGRLNAYLINITRKEITSRSQDYGQWYNDV